MQTRNRIRVELVLRSGAKNDFEITEEILNDLEEFRQALYVACGRSGSVSVIDTAREERLADIPVGKLPWGSRSLTEACVCQGLLLVSRQSLS